MERFHGFVGIPLIVLLLGLSVWMLWQTAQQRPLDRRFVMLIYIAQVLVIGQAIIGAVLMIAGSLVPATGLAHIILGTASALLPSGVALSIRNTDAGRRRWLPALGMFAVTMIALLAFVTG